ncbi:MAG TPA: hypothetical protein VFV55_04090 [Usitatibacteraceae bacterium]|nr:hypothetical protein [Usitatibacteraceae bacterium]
MFICVVIGMWPIRGTLKLSRLRRRRAAAAGFLAIAPPIVEGGPPGRVSGPPPAVNLVIVDDAAEAGRAPAAGFGAPIFRNQSASEVLSPAAGALAMVFSVQRDIEGGADARTP